jgi:hypothetical protein
MVCLIYYQFFTQKNKRYWWSEIGDQRAKKIKCGYLSLLRVAFSFVLEMQNESHFYREKRVRIPQFHWSNRLVPDGSWLKSGTIEDYFL